MDSHIYSSKSSKVCLRQTIRVYLTASIYGLSIANSAQCWPVKQTNIRGRWIGISQKANSRMLKDLWSGEVNRTKLPLRILRRLGGKSCEHLPCNYAQVCFAADLSLVVLNGPQGFLTIVNTQHTQRWLSRSYIPFFLILLLTVPPILNLPLLCPRQRGRI